MALVAASLLKFTARIAQMAVAGQKFFKVCFFDSDGTMFFFLQLFPSISAERHGVGPCFVALPVLTCMCCWCHAVKERYTPTAAAFGTIADAAVTASAKLDDRDINALLDIQGASSAYYRVTSPDESVHYYARDDDSAFIDTARAWNIFAGSRSTCMATALSSCSWCSTTYDSFDTLYDCHSSGEGLRYFEQHSGSTLRCYAHNDATKRCISRGSDHNYAQFNDIVLWVRRNPS
eukprot:m.107824 g.107824  ORF g.107824 m.107824 type:complete len:234 (-) comp9231_c0_seq1:213-914(-)